MVGFLLGGLGAALEYGAVVWAAIALLGVALVLRMIDGRRKSRAASPRGNGSARPDE
ncbi:MAG TPA: hypothetical protein VFM14_01545 [Gemmatimonadales bacterium]|nr:hypothetical protein [Gemmatimonadales bacterium]